MSNMNNANKSTKSGSRPGQGNQPQKNKNKNKNPGKKKINYSSSDSNFRTAPLAKGSLAHTGQPQIRTQGKVTVVSHREFIRNVSLGTSFTVSQTLRCNPGSVSTFQWLSQVALNYEMYRFRKLHFCFTSRANATQSGSLISAFDYDVNDAVPFTEQQISQYEGALEGNLWMDHLQKYDPARANAAFKRHYVQDDVTFASFPPLTDYKTIDGAYLVFGGEAAASSIYFKLWVEYEVELSIPHIITPPLSSGGQGVRKTTGLATSPSDPFATNANSGIGLDANSGNILNPSTVFSSSAQVGVFARDWTGILERELEGTTLVSGGALNLNGTPITQFATGIINSIGTRAHDSFSVTAKEGDVITQGPISAGTLTKFLLNLAGSQGIVQF